LSAAEPRDHDLPHLAASIEVLMCHGSYGESTPVGSLVLLTLAGEDLRPGAVMLGHGNHHAVTQLLPQIAELALLAAAC
jgi:hypothetical protein